MMTTCSQVSSGIESIFCFVPYKNNNNNEIHY